MSMSVWEKWISKKNLIYSDKMQTFYEISDHSHNDWRSHDSVSAYA